MYNSSGTLVSLDDPDTVGAGESLHISTATSTTNPLLQYSFYGASCLPGSVYTSQLAELTGTGISLYGSSNCSLSVVLDGVLDDIDDFVEDDLIFSDLNLSNSTLHSITLWTQNDPGCELALDRAIVSSTVTGESVKHSLHSPWY